MSQARSFTSEDCFGRGRGVTVTSSANRERCPFGFEGCYAAPKAWEEPSLRRHGCSDKVAPSTMPWCSLNHPKGSSVKGFVIKLRVIPLVFKVTGNFR